MDKHSFIICAYKESPYLEECVQSLMSQTVKSAVKIVTSTPCDYITGIAVKYDIPLVINHGESGIAQDWNFALANSITQYVTIAHQDDVYEPEYTEKMISRLEQAKYPLIAFCEYSELREGKKFYSTPLIRIKKLMLLPMKIRFFSDSKFIRRRCMSLGNPICCPAVTYAMENLSQPVFKIGCKRSIMSTIQAKTPHFCGT